MKTRLKNLILASFFIFSIASPLAVVAVAQPVSAATECEASLLGLPPWYRGLTNQTPPKCDLLSVEQVGGISNYIWHIALNVVEMAIVLIAYLAVFFIIYGGFLFMTGGNNPSQIEKGRKTILNAVIGLVICIGAVALTRLIFTIIP